MYVPNFKMPIRFLVAGLLAASLTACGGGDMSDLRLYAEQTKSRPGGRVKPLPEIKTYETFVYQPYDRRDPFTVSEEAPDSGPTPEGDGIQPDLNRRREELEAFSLDTLRMVGTLEQIQDVWGVVRDNGGTVHRVRVGNYMGLNHGQITEVTETEIKLTEIVLDGRGTWREKQAIVALSE